MKDLIVNDYTTYKVVQNPVMFHLLIVGAQRDIEKHMTAHFLPTVTSFIC